MLGKKAVYRKLEGDNNGGMGGGGQEGGQGNGEREGRRGGKGREEEGRRGGKRVGERGKGMGTWEERGWGKWITGKIYTNHIMKISCFLEKKS